MLDLSRIFKYITPQTVLDIGAHEGDFCDQMRSFKNYDRYFAIEGNIHCKEKLSSKGVETFFGLLGKEKSKANFYRRKGNLACTGSSLYRELSEHFNDENVVVSEEEIVNLDSIFDYKDKFDFIKIDTQGSELDIISGGRNICGKSKAILLEVAVLPYNEGAPLYEEVVQYMQDFGYEPVDVIGQSRYPDGTVFQVDVLFLNKEYIKTLI
jgi:FkbM family methyltransferase